MGRPGPSPQPTAPVRLADVAAGPPPTTAWLDGRDYVAGDGTRTTLPFDDVVRAAPYRGSFLLVRYGDGHVIWLDHDLDGEARWCGHGSLAVSQDGASTAFAVSPATPDCTGGAGTGNDGSELTLHLGPNAPSSAPDQTRPMPLQDGALVGVLGNAVVVSPYNEGAPALLGLDGTSTTIDQLSQVKGVNARLGLVSGLLAGSGQDGSGPEPPTGAVLDPATGSVSWTKPGWELLTFSPDGSMVIGLRPGGPDAMTWGVFDASTGTQLHGFTTPAGFEFRTLVWEDDEHVLMDTTQGGTQAIVRVGLDGAIQLATEPSPFDGDTQDLRYALAPNAFP